MEIQRFGLTKQLQLLPLAILSLVRDILELNYCTKLFHRTVHALSAQLCKTRRNIGVSRGKHHCNKTALSIAFFAAFSAFFPHFSAFFAHPGAAFPPPPPASISGWVCNHQSPFPGDQRHCSPLFQGNC